MNNNDYTPTQQDFDEFELWFDEIWTPDALDSVYEDWQEVVTDFVYDLAG